MVAKQAPGATAPDGSQYVVISDGAGNLGNTTTDTVSLPAAGTSVVGTKAAGTAAATSLLTGAVYSSTIPVLTNGQQIATQADTTGATRVNMEGGKATYFASTAISPETSGSSQDFFVIGGSATKTVKITKIIISGTATAAGEVDLLIAKRSSADSGGTSAAVTPAALDSANAAATATVANYSVHPTQGTLAGIVAQWHQPLYAAPGASAPTQPFTLEFGTRNSQPIVLRGTAQQFILNNSTVVPAGTVIKVNVEFTEE